MTDKQTETPALVSVIVPCHNYGHFLSETLDSLIAQTYPHWECLVIDNGSEDNTVEVAKQYMQADKRFVIYSIPLSTTSRTRNFGIARSKGQFVLFLDSDDQIAASKLEKSIKILSEHVD
ncbi:MAG: glycosyltransferase family 2 protein, partial [Bacteroidetes bacterium]|nr:glycosyltransferase family 2 protein [Bacteroidota bacterium]